jgi:hypothetical protein
MVCIHSFHSAICIILLVIYKESRVRFVTIVCSVVEVEKNLEKMDHCRKLNAFEYLVGAFSTFEGEKSCWPQCIHRRTALLAKE